MAELRPRRPAEGHRDLRQPLDQPVSPPSPGCHELGQALGEDAARAAPVSAEKLPDPERSHDADVCPWEIRQSALIITMDAARGKPAHGTMHQSL
jgi:hypothetical protein